MIPTDAHDTAHALLFNGWEMVGIFAIACGVAILLTWYSFVDGRTRYPDGTCFQCRRGAAMPGETCTACGTKQPDGGRP